MGPFARLLVYIGLFYLAARVATFLLRKAASARGLRRPPRKETKKGLDRSEIEDAEWEEMDDKKRPGSG